eukprot:TRINITY_DN1361_c0_g1_i1.p1 TRINITY_DN1361_c0_g1~~TRINITY_DN1361_c0_g1_i1.p1  ORF type:complete len:132 (-),score=32.67 TRINITY_DN1361_c0_g1_i1:7-402(-)
MDEQRTTMQKTKKEYEEYLKTQFPQWPAMEQRLSQIQQSDRDLTQEIKDLRNFQHLNGVPSDEIIFETSNQLDLIEEELELYRKRIAFRRLKMEQMERRCMMYEDFSSLASENDYLSSLVLQRMSTTLNST